MYEAGPPSLKLVHVAGPRYICEFQVEVGCEEGKVERGPRGQGPFSGRIGVAFLGVSNLRPRQNILVHVGFVIN